MARTSYQKEEVEVFVYEETRFEFKTINHTSYQGSNTICRHRLR